LFLHFLLNDRLFFYLTQKSQKSQKFFVLRTLLLSCSFFYCPAKIKEIKEIFRFALYAQPVPEALSFISFISAGLKILCAACAEGTFCDFREFLCDL